MSTAHVLPHQLFCSMTKTWFSPFPRIQRANASSVAALSEVDQQIQSIERLIANLKKQRKEIESHEDSVITACLDYLGVIENQRRAESELTRLLNERLKAVLLADMAYDENNRGDHFPHPTAEAHANEFIIRQKERLAVVSAVAYVGMSVTFSTILSAARGSIGLVSLAWAAFSVSLTICIYVQWVNPTAPIFAIVAYPGRRTFRVLSSLIACGFSVLGLVFMGLAIAILDLEPNRETSVVDTRIKTYIGGWLGLAPVILGFPYGFCTILWHEIWVTRLRRQRQVNHALG